MTIRLGAHVDSTDPLTEAAAIGGDAVQIFLGDPQSWKKPATLYPGGAEALKSAAEAAGVGIVVHSPYVINVASTNNRIRIPSRKLLQQTVTEARTRPSATPTGASASTDSTCPCRSSSRTPPAAPRP